MNDELEDLIAAFVAAQEPLGKEFEDVWDDNIEELYEP